MILITASRSGKTFRIFRNGKYIGYFVLSIDGEPGLHGACLDRSSVNNTSLDEIRDILYNNFKVDSVMLTYLPPFHTPYDDE